VCVRTKRTTHTNYLKRRWTTVQIETLAPLGLHTQIHSTHDGSNLDARAMKATHKSNDDELWLVRTHDNPPS
jgi:hypothetical protein